MRISLKDCRKKCDYRQRIMEKTQDKIINQTIGCKKKKIMNSVDTSWKKKISKCVDQSREKTARFDNLSWENILKFTSQSQG